MAHRDAIVVIDADREVRTLIELAIGGPERTVHAFASVEAALGFVQQAERADLVVAGEQEAAALVRSLGSRAGSAIARSILLTADDDAQSTEPAVRDAARLRKPFEIGELRAIVDRSLRGERDTVRRLDPVTGLHTSLEFEADLRSAHARAAAAGSALAVVIGEVQDLAAFEARFGVECRDRMLARVAAIVASQLRSTDSAARVAAATFGTVHPECGADGALAVARRIHEAVTAADDCQGIGMALGVAVDTAPAKTDPDRVRAAADDALLAAKAGGRTPIELRVV